jgi:hypothetical protein
MSEALEKQAIEKEQWQDMYMKKVEAEIQQREVNMIVTDHKKIFKEKLLADRDREIEEIIEKLEAETNSSATDIARKYRLEIEKVKATMSEEIKQVLLYLVLNYRFVMNIVWLSIRFYYSKLH